MEYSVRDLVRILLKKWYIVLLAMLVIGGLSLITARNSYQKAVSDYESYTAEKDELPTDPGNLTSIYQFHYKVTDMSNYISKASDKADFINSYVAQMQEAGYNVGEPIDIYQEAETAYADVSTVLDKLLMDSVVLQRTQTAAIAAGYVEPDKDNVEVIIDIYKEDDDEEDEDESAYLLKISKYLTVEWLDSNTIRTTVFGLEKQSCEEILKAYISAIKDVGEKDYQISITAKKLSDEFYIPDEPYTDTPQLAQKVMQPPEYTQTLVKTVGTAASFAFVFACLTILLVTFVQDSRVQKRKTEDEQQSD